MIKPFGVPLVGAVLGTVLALGAWHLYLDHVTVDQVRAILAAQASRPQPQPEAK